ncbi:MAG: hypothetical protein HY671_03170 [Chloroflexi bacterium]|nr:hypothetical protein [Chloroflexota bacterium]
MSQSRRAYRERDQAALQLRLQAPGDPEIASYIASLKKKYRRYAMSSDDAREVVDSAMGNRTLTEFLYDARDQAG